MVKPYPSGVVEKVPVPQAGDVRGRGRGRGGACNTFRGLARVATVEPLLAPIEE